MPEIRRHSSQRKPRPSKRRRQTQPELSWGDRLICALFGGALGFITGAITYLIVLGFLWRPGAREHLSFYYVWIMAGIAAIFSAAAGPERMMDLFTEVWSCPRFIRELAGGDDNLGDNNAENGD